MIKCTLDYETRSKADLKLLGPIEYAKHESTSILCVAYMIDDEPVKLWLPERAPMPKRLWQAFQEGLIVAHNAGFERAVTKYCLTRYPLITDAQCAVLERLAPHRWKCTAAKAAYSALPRSLEGACNVLDLPIKKDMEGNRLMKKYMKPRKPSKKNPALWWDDKTELRHIYKYCMIDVKAEHLLDNALPDLPEHEQEIWEVDQIVNARGILIDVNTVKIILKMIAEEQKEITKAVYELTNGEIEKATQTAKVLAWINHRGGEMQNLQAGTIKEKLLEDDLDDDIREMLELRQSASKTSTAKYIKMLYAVGADNRARELLLYGGAVPTMRWTGKRIQPQNFPRPTIKDFNSDEAIELIRSGGLHAIRKKYGKTKVMDVLASAIRGMLIASPGHELFCADFAAVELNIAFWITEHKEGLQAIREKRKMYEEMAMEIFGLTMGEIMHPDFKNTLERFVGKETILGAQYGMGFLKFLKTLHMKGRKEVTPAIAKKAINGYRNKHWPIPAYWKSIETLFIKAVQNPTQTFRLTKVRVFMDGDFLCIRLPSGRDLKYFKPRISFKQLASGRMVPQIHYWYNDPKFGWVEGTLWGGIIFNHIVQGCARDFMAHGILQIEDAGFRFLISVHDEAVAEAPIGTRTVKEFIKLMAGNLPEWGKDAPIMAEGWKNLRYKK